MAALLDYPDRSTVATAESCAPLLRTLNPEANEGFACFLNFLSSHPLAQIEEIYTATFDLQPACYPYVGYQLCGENQKRALFLMRLQQLYRQHDFAIGEELPDHLVTLLHFVASVDNRQCREDLVFDGILPALDKMLSQTEQTDNPYIQLLQVVRLALAQNAPTTTVAPAELPRKEVCS